MYLSLKKGNWKTADIETFLMIKQRFLIPVSLIQPFLTWNVCDKNLQMARAWQKMRRNRANWVKPYHFFCTDWPS